MANILTLILVGLSVGLDNFAVSIAIGLSGVSRELRLKVGVLFGLFETGMPIIGLVIGSQLARQLGGHTNLIGGGLLIATGIYSLLKTRYGKQDEPELNAKFKKLLLTALALSIDNLIIGFSLGTTKVSLPEAVVVLGATSVSLSLLGLELGSRLKNSVEDYSELLSGLILVAVGLAVGFRLI